MLEVDAGGDSLSEMEVDVDENDEACRLGTAEFEAWAAKFLDRIFVMVSPRRVMGHGCEMCH